MGFSISKSTDGCTFRTNSSAWRRLKGIASVVMLIASADPVFALGVGGVNTKSYIGEQLLVEIPLYNVESPDTLELNLERLDGQLNDGLTAELNRSNSQLSIVIRSQNLVNEPYYNFAINLVDQGNALRKEFTVLLDLSPSDSRSSYYSDSSTPSTQQVSSSGAELNNSTRDVTTERANYVGSSNNQSGNSVLGPYDWAKAGAIPKTFGAVIDGQSLWRVARRISPAMNVTNNQMMLALYELNPEAFSNTSIESLRAGVYLNIPTEAQVVEYSDLQAKKRLDELSSSVVQTLKKDSGEPKSVAPIATAESSSNVVSDETVGDLTQGSETDDLIEQSNKKAAIVNDENSQFQLSGLDQQVSDTGELVSVQDDQSKEIINSLAQTISSMTEQLQRKDEQIDVLEDQILELKTFISQDDDVASLVKQEPVQDADIVSEPLESKTSFFDSLYVWVALILALILAAVFMMRERLKRLWTALNFNDDNNDIDLQASELEVPEHQLFSSQEFKTVQSVEPSDTDLSQSKSDDDASVSFADSEMANSELSELSEHEFSDALLFDEVELYVEEESGEVSEEETVNFIQRFSQLTAEGKLDLARQLLEIAHGHEIESDAYHFHRLQLLAFDKNEDKFYDYYATIENDIPGFSSAVQTDISKLVVNLAQRDYNFA